MTTSKAQAELKARLEEKWKGDGSARERPPEREGGSAWPVIALVAGLFALSFGGIRLASGWALHGAADVDLVASAAQLRAAGDREVLLTGALQPAPGATDDFLASVELKPWRQHKMRVVSTSAPPLTVALDDGARVAIGRGYRFLTADNETFALHSRPRAGVWMEGVEPGDRACFLGRWDARASIFHARHVFTGSPEEFRALAAGQAHDFRLGLAVLGVVLGAVVLLTVTRGRRA